MPAGQLGSFSVLVPTLFTVTNLNDSGPGSLRQAITDGNALLGPTVTQRLLEHFGSGEPVPDAAAMDSLTEREREILQLLASGLSNAEIATRLVVTEATVKTHVSSILRKLGVRDRVQAVIAAYDASVVSPRRSEAPFRSGSSG